LVGKKSAGVGFAAGVVAETGELSTAAGSDFVTDCVLSCCTCGNSPGWCLSQEQITTTAAQTQRLFPNPENLRGCPKASDDPIGGGTVMAFLPSVQGGKWEWQAANAESCRLAAI